MDLFFKFRSKKLLLLEFFFFRAINECFFCFLILSL